MAHFSSVQVYIKVASDSSCSCTNIQKAILLWSLRWSLEHQGMVVFNQAQSVAVLDSLKQSCFVMCCLVEYGTADSTMFKRVGLHCFLKFWNSHHSRAACFEVVRERNALCSADFPISLPDQNGDQKVSSLRSRWLQWVKHPCKNPKGIRKYLG